MYTFLLNYRAYLSQSKVTSRDTFIHIYVIPFRTVSSGNSISEMNLLATSIKAYLGQLGNQSKEVQLIRDGNFLHLTLNVYPTGLMHKIMCKFSLMQLMNKFHKYSGES